MFTELKSIGLKVAKKIDFQIVYKEIKIKSGL
ncbi:MAG: hypothetical protein ACJAXF_003162 [Polaribacter sp.]|jgi:hypothetical protein